MQNVVHPRYSQHNKNHIVLTCDVIVPWTHLAHLNPTTVFLSWKMMAYQKIHSEHNFILHKWQPWNHRALLKYSAYSTEAQQTYHNATHLESVARYHHTLLLTSYGKRLSWAQGMVELFWYIVLLDTTGQRYPIPVHIYATNVHDSQFSLHSLYDHHFWITRHLILLPLRPILPFVDGNGKSSNVRKI